MVGGAPSPPTYGIAYIYGLPYRVPIVSNESLVTYSRHPPVYMYRQIAPDADRVLEAAAFKAATNKGMTNPIYLGRNKMIELIGEDISPWSLGSRIGLEVNIGAVRDATKEGRYIIAGSGATISQDLRFANASEFFKPIPGTPSVYSLEVDSMILAGARPISLTPCPVDGGVLRPVFLKNKSVNLADPFLFRSPLESMLQETTIHRGRAITIIDPIATARPVDLTPPPPVVMRPAQNGTRVGVMSAAGKAIAVVGEVTMPAAIAQQGFDTVGDLNMVLEQRSHPERVNAWNDVYLHTPEERRLYFMDIVPLPVFAEDVFYARNFGKGTNCKDPLAAAIYKGDIEIEGRGGYIEGAFRRIGSAYSYLGLP